MNKGSIRKKDLSPEVLMLLILNIRENIGGKTHLLIRGRYFSEIPVPATAMHNYDPLHSANVLQATPVQSQKKIK